MQYKSIPPPSPDPQDDDSRIVASGSAGHLALCSLILDAVGIPHHLPRGQNIITVPEARAEEARYQIDSYFAENADWPEPPPLPMTRLTGPQPTVLLMGCLAVFFLVTGPWNERTAWFANGAIDSMAILAKSEWWRLVTALTLHADLLHLIGNCVIGGFMVHLLVGQLGSGVGWMSLILCGAVGNFLNIAARETVHHSVGFSTSIFGAIGMFSGMQMLADKNIRPRNVLLPLGAGAGLLAMLGAEGERTDLGAHFFGFLCGLVLGVAARTLGLHRLAENSSLQRTLLISAISIIIVCWLLAMK